MNALRVAAVGVWHVHAGEYVDEMLENPAFDVVGVFDEDGEAAAAFAEARNLPVLDSFAEAIGDSVDAIVVDTATSEHARVIGAALAAGKHVFTEKVLASDLATACALEEQAAEAGKCLFVSLQRLAEPWIYEMIEVIRSGQIGDITSSRFRYQHGGVVEGWLPAAFLNADEAQGGSIIDLGAHGYYLSNLFHDAFPESVTSVGSYVTGAAVEDHSVVVLSYPGGRTSVLETSLVAGPYSPGARSTELRVLPWSIRGMTRCACGSIRTTTTQLPGPSERTVRAGPRRLFDGLRPSTRGCVTRTMCVRPCA